MSICFIFIKTEQLKRNYHIFKYLDTRGTLGLDDVSELCSSDHSFDNTEQLKRNDHIFKYLDTRGTLGLHDVSELGSSYHSFDNSNDGKPVGSLLGVSVG